jgi:5-methylthioadenosine/S-adenosylhomocysteine deaminase
LRQLPPHLAKPLRLQLEHETAPIDDQLGMFEDLWHKWNARDRSRVQLAPANLHWVSDDGLRMVAERAVRFDVGIHIHLLETPYQKEYAHRRHGQSAVEHLRDLGLLDARTTLGHAVWVSEDEIELVAEMSALLCHNAGSNLRLQSGIAPLNEFLRRGIAVGLGMDEAGINDDRDMLNEMRLVLNLHRTPGIGARVPTVAEVFRMATEQGARTTGFGPSIGRLDVGRSADTVLIDWEDLATPYLHEGVRVLDAILYRARSRTSVRAVTVAGEVIYENGSFTRLDRDVALAELTKSFNAPLRPEELERERIGRELLAHYADFYRDWTGPSGSAPFYLMNSRH